MLSDSGVVDVGRSGAGELGACRGRGRDAGVGVGFVGL